MAAELLGELAEARRMQIAEEGPAHLELAARPRCDRLDQRPLGRRELFFRNEGQTRRRLLRDGLRFGGRLFGSLGGHWLLGWLVLAELERIHTRLFPGVAVNGS